jgi:F-type H+-transporting ATPase subunit a
LIEELQCETVFTIPIFGGIPVSESVVVTWIIMAVLVLLSVILVRNLKVENPGKKQLVLETIVSSFNKLFEGVLGEHGKEYVPYLITVILYIGIANLAGVFGFKPPTKDINVTAALAIMSIVLVQISGIRGKGTKGWLKSFTQPVAVVTPLNILELGIKPLSLCMRLFGNVLGAFVIMKLIEAVVPLIVPVALSLYFDLFDGLLQAFVFTFLTTLYMQEAME